MTFTWRLCMTGAPLHYRGNKMTVSDETDQKWQTWSEIDSLVLTSLLFVIFVFCCCLQQHQQREETRELCAPSSSVHIYHKHCLSSEITVSQLQRCPVIETIQTERQSRTKKMSEKGQNKGRKRKEDGEVNITDSAKKKSEMWTKWGWKTRQEVM